MPATREIIAENIATLRKSAKLTQAELAEKLNYSDKAISKWERGDSVPDVIVLSEIAELFSVTVDYFLHPHAQDEKKPKLEAEKKRLRISIALTSCISPYFISVLLYYIFNSVYSSPDWLWKLYVIPLPIVAIIALVFSSVWYKEKHPVFASLTALLWTSLLVAFVFMLGSRGAWFIFVLGVPLQLIIFFWMFGLHRKKAKQ